MTEEELSDKKDELETRNIVDYYAYWENEAIRADLDKKRFNYSILCVNLQHDLNLSNIIRSSNAFLAKEVIIYGRKKYDRRGAVGTYNYMHFKHVREADGLPEVFDKYDNVIGVDNVDDAVAIGDYNWNTEEDTLICFGQESNGLPEEILDKCNDIVYIRQYGSVRSLNVASAASVIMNDYCMSANK